LLIFLILELYKYYGHLHSASNECWTEAVTRLSTLPILEI
jgi:hypothetical protein